MRQARKRSVRWWNYNARWYIYRLFVDLGRVTKVKQRTLQKCGERLAAQ
jgi:fatty-acid desaturase